MTMFNANSFFNDKSFSISKVNEINIAPSILEMKQADKTKYFVGKPEPIRLQHPPKTNNLLLLLLSVYLICFWLPFKFSKVFNSMRSLLS